MILAKGKVYDSSEQGRILATLEAEINRTRAEKTISTEEVIAALDILGKKLNSGEFDEAINALGIDGISEYAAMAADMLSRGNVTRKVETELGTDYFEEKEIASPYGKIKAKAMPLVHCSISRGECRRTARIQRGGGIAHGECQYTETAAGGQRLVGEYMPEADRNRTEDFGFSLCFRYAIRRCERDEEDGGYLRRYHSVGRRRGDNGGQTLCKA